MADKIYFRRGTAAQWILKNPILGPGEPGYEIGSGRIKIGDGVTRWMLLPYYAGESSGNDTPLDLTEHINDETPHPVYDDMPSVVLQYENAKV